MEVVNGDLIELAKGGEFDVIIHGCNCFNTMSSGIAYQIKTNFPSAYEADLKTIRGDRTKLGSYTQTNVKCGGFSKRSRFTIINAYTQFHWNTNNTKTITKENPRGVAVNYGAVENVFNLIHKDYGRRGLKFGIPKIGAGLAGGDWYMIRDIINNIMFHENVTLVEYK